jgi:cytochrome P450
VPPWYDLAVRLPPGPSAPAIWQLVQWLHDPIGMLEACGRRHGDAFTLRLWKLGPHSIFFSAPEDVRQIFQAPPDQLLVGEGNDVLEPFMGKGSLFLLDGERHAAQRRLMQPPFSSDRMRAYFQIMIDAVDREIEGWPLREPFPLLPAMLRIALDIILRAVFGLREQGELARMRLEGQEILRRAGHPVFLLPALQVDLGPLSPWGRVVRFRERFDAFLYAQIARSRAEQGARDDILALLARARDEQGEAMTDAALRDELVTLLLAGHETTAITLAWAFHWALATPGVLDALRRELAEVVGEGPASAEHVPALRLAEAALLETMRLTPTAPNTSRKVARPIRIGRWDLPAGVEVRPCMHLAHRDPARWPAPERFDPARFLGRRVAPHEFFPFGGGVRRCLGAAFAMYEMRVALARILGRVELARAGGKPARAARRGILVAPSDGVMVVVLSRR